MKVLTKLVLILGITLAHAIACQAANINMLRIDVWPEGKIPGKDVDQIKDKTGQVPQSRNAPFMQVYLPATKNQTGFMIICPGGAYVGLATGHEGTQIAKWLSSNNIPCAILNYRIPHKPQAALMDIQRAIRIVRENAKKWNIDTNRIAIMGFSAGANLCARASTNFDVKTYEPIDNIDKHSARPNFTGLIYPAYCDNIGNEKRWKGTPVKKGIDYSTEFKLADNLKIKKNTPPTFIVQTQDDYYGNAAIAYYLALKKNNISANLHMFDKGGHGYGIAKKGELVDAWDSLFLNWLKHNNIDGNKQKK